MIETWILILTITQPTTTYLPFQMRVGPFHSELECEQAGADAKQSVRDPDALVEFHCEPRLFNTGGL